MDSPEFRRCQRVQFSDRVVDVSVVTRRPVPMILNVQKTVEVPQIQFVDKIVDAPVVVAHQPVPVDAEALSQTQSVERVGDISVVTQLASRKRKSSMETESAESVDEMSDAAHGLVEGEACRLKVNETRERSAAEEGEGLDLLQVAPERGGLWLTPPGHNRGGANRGLDARPARDPPNGRVPGAPGKKARREGGRGGQEAGKAGDRAR